MVRRALFLFMAFAMLATTNVSHADTTRFRGAMISPQVQAGDLQTLGLTWKANFIRWQLNWNAATAFNATPEQYDAWLESALSRLDALLPVCEQSGLKVLVDLHTPPGGRNSSTKQSRIFYDAQCQSQFLRVWNKIATRYANNKTVWGYDLANEPIQGKVASGLLNWHQLATATAVNIRQIDSTHAIVVEPDWWASADGFKNFAPLPSSISNVVYSAHMYEPSIFTHQGVLDGFKMGYRYPGIVKLRMWDKAQLRKYLQPIVDFQKRYGVRILIGEFSAIRWAPAGSAYNYLRDVIDIFESNGWDWTYHAFREWHGWSVEHTEDKNNTNPATSQTNREKLLRFYFGKNTKL